MADWGGGRKWWLIRSPRLTFSIASFLLINPSPHEFHPPFNSDSLAESYLVGSKYLLLISTASTCFEFENIWFLLQCYAASISSTLGGSNCSRPPWLVLGRLCLDLKRGERSAFFPSYSTWQAGNLTYPGYLTVWCYPINNAIFWQSSSGGELHILIANFSI